MCEKLAAIEQNFKVVKMIKALIGIVLVLATVDAVAQNRVQFDSQAQGIRFVKGLSWSQILEKAKIEKKYIFVDCCASWCGPCKKMEAEVYSRQDVGDQFNSHFISVKAQLDTGKADDLPTRAFYASAHFIGSQYKIAIYPTLLFFTPDGRILNRVFGAIPADEFSKIADNVQDPKKDYYALLAQYKSGTKDLATMRYLALTAQSLLNDSVEAETLARDCFSTLEKNELLLPANISFAREFTRRSDNPEFLFFFKNSDTIDKIMRDASYSESIIQRIIYAEFVAPEVRKCKKSQGTPDWNSIGRSIAEKFNSYYRDRVILGAKSDWSATRKEWGEHTRDMIRFVETYGARTDTGGKWQAFYLNAYAWDIFQHSADTAELHIAFQWSARSVMMDPLPTSLDTYANILYKLGQVSYALKWEAISVALAPNQKAIKSNYDTMVAGKPTWPPN